MYGQQRAAIAPDRAGPATTAGQCQPVEPQGFECDIVCRRAGPQVARLARTPGQPAHHLHPQEPLGEERRARRRLREIAARWIGTISRRHGPMWTCIRCGRDGWEMRRRIGVREPLRRRQVEIAGACWTWKNPEEPWGGKYPATHAGRTWVGVRWLRGVVGRFGRQLNTDRIRCEIDRTVARTLDIPDPSFVRELLNREPGLSAVEIRSTAVPEHGS